MTGEKKEKEPETPSPKEGEFVTYGIARGGLTYGGVTTTPPTYWASSPPTWTATAKMKSKPVKYPERVTKKVLVSFLDDDDSPAWAKKLKLIDMNIDLSDLEHGTLELTLSLEDIYDNESTTP